MFVLGKSLQLGLIFESKAGAQPEWSNIKASPGFGWKDLPETKTISYLAAKSVTA